MCALLVVRTRERNVFFSDRKDDFTELNRCCIVEDVTCNLKPSV